MLKKTIEDKLCFWSGLNYMDCHEYSDACDAFEVSKAYKHLVVAYEKQGYYQKALELADQKHYYVLGSKIALHHKDLRQAAYFYNYFDPLQAAKIYRHLNDFYEAGFAFLSAYKPLIAIDMFRKCQQKSQRTKGFKQVSEFALVLYLKKQYSSAFRIFIALDDYYSALECARGLKEDKLIAGCHLLIALNEAEKRNYLFSAKCLEPYFPVLSTYYYALAGSYNDQVRVLLATGEYKKAFKACLLHHNLNKAYQIASTYAPELLTS